MERHRELTEQADEARIDCDATHLFEAVDMICDGWGFSRPRRLQRHRTRLPTWDGGSLLLVFMLVAGLAPRAARAQTPTARDCMTQEELEERRRQANMLTSSAPSAGYHGLIYSFGIASKPDTGPRLAGPVVLDAVLCRSPAHEAGLAGGDVILSVNGTVLGQGVDVQALRALKAERPGMKFELRVRRGERVLDVTFESVPRPRKTQGRQP